MNNKPPGYGDTLGSFGYSYLKKYGWQNNTPLSPNAIIEPLFQLKGFFDEKPVTYLRKVFTEKDKRKFTLCNEIYDLTFEDIDTITKPSQYQPKVQYFKLGSHDGPLLKQIGDRIQEIRLWKTSDE